MAHNSLIQQIFMEETTHNHSGIGIRFDFSSKNICGFILALISCIKQPLISSNARCMAEEEHIGRKTNKCRHLLEENFTYQKASHHVGVGAQKTA